MGVRIWDRLLDVEAPPAPGRGLLGRSLFLPGDRELSLNGATVRPGRYLSAEGGWALWDEKEHGRTEGDFGYHAMPDDITAYVVTAIGRRVAALVAEGTAEDQWLAETPLMGGADMDERLRPQAIDEEIELRLPHLRAACHDPVTRLRTVERLVPASQVRRVTPNAIARLTARSEDWGRLRPDGIRPARLLNPGREVDLDFYENRVLARLVDHLWHHVQARLVEVSRIQAMLDDVTTYTDDASGRPWRESHYMFTLIEALVQSPGRRESAQRLRQDLAKLRDALVELRGPAVLPGVHRRTDVGAALRTTNVFTNDERYRNAAALWRAWIGEKTGRTPSGSHADRAEEWCQAFTHYTALLLLHAFTHLGLPPAGAFAPGGDALSIGRGAEGISLRWEPTGTFTLIRGQDTLLRIVPIAHALTASGQAGIVAQELEALRPAATTEPPTLVVYPGQRDERAGLPLAHRLQVFQGCDAPAPSSGAWGLSLLPVSPLEIDSVTRLARSLRWSLTEHLVRGYPPRIVCPADHARSIVGDSKWLAAAPDGIRLLRPPAPHELAAVQRRVDALSARAAQFRWRGDNADLIQHIAAELARSVEWMAEFTRCPLCRAASADPARTFRPRDNHTFRSRCDACDIGWELRRCASCGHGYPVLNAAPIESTTDDQGGSAMDGDGIDREFGSETLSARCWMRPAVAVCPHCGNCGETSAASRSACDRCGPSMVAAPSGRAVTKPRQ
ncbi:hypothetical protein [Actinoallomurus sp. NPDC052274]|uniref:hypothetical protein n=1 Tax=Actinoallomurus sp. NPDC052274 TaxID=3155420 RepID=UPI003427D7C1